MQYTPMIQQYLQVKENYRDAILFFRLGDFYEMFFRDAEIASRELEITLTARDGGKAGKIPMCGVPYHSAETYIARLIAKNHKVAVCDQVELPGESKGIVRREVTRVVTPGTIMEGQLLDDKSHNYLACVACLDGRWGLAFADITTGHFMATRFSGPRAGEALGDELNRLMPREVLTAGEESLPEDCDGDFMCTCLEAEEFSPARARKWLEKHYGSGWRQSCLDSYPEAVCAAGCLLGYLYETQKGSLAQLGAVGVYSTGEFMVLDAATRRNLELTVSLAGGGRRGTLLSVLDFTRTAMGGRMLRSWLEQPLMDAGEIGRRHDAVERIAGDLFLRDKLQELLDPVYDLERLGGKVAGGSANARDLVSLRQSLEYIPGLKDALRGSGAPYLEEIARETDGLEDIRSLLESSVVEDPPLSVREGGIIKEGYSEEVDGLRCSATDGKTWLAELEATERERTGIKSLKVRYNKVFGYYIEVTRANLGQVPEDYIRKQTLVNAERFITPRLKEYEELILGARDRLVQVEYELFSRVRERVAGALDRIQRSAKGIAAADALLSLAEAAARNNYVRPELTDKKELVIKEGRHPVVESMLGTGQFVPNDTFLNSGQFISLITGPNMAGKSTYMRQVALIVLMAQAGSFVPAGEARLGITDRIFTRVGAADDLAGGRSTFMVEMSECRTIMEYGTERSLIIMDEVGRGTSTYDGISLARSMVEYIHGRIKARTLFSTHYHELTGLDSLPGVKNYTMPVREQGEEIIFLRRLEPGRADRSYGIQVARLAGLPEEILARAREVLRALEENQIPGEASVKEVSAGAAEVAAGSNHRQEKNDLLQRIQSANVMQMTPLQALNTIAKWQEILVELEKGNGKVHNNRT